MRRWLRRLGCLIQGHEPPHSYWVSADGMAHATCLWCGDYIVRSEVQVRGS